MIVGFMLQKILIWKLTQIYNKLIFLIIMILRARSLLILSSLRMIKLILIVLMLLKLSRCGRISKINIISLIILQIIIIILIPSISIWLLFDYLIYNFYYSICFLKWNKNIYKKCVCTFKKIFHILII